MGRFSGLLVCLLFVSCEGVFMDKQKTDTPQNNFDLLWEIFDERYCFFEEKNIDWDSIYTVYYRSLPTNRTNKTTIDRDLFNLMSSMLLELHDGHVCISNSEETRAYYEWRSKYPENYSENLISHYLNRRRTVLNNDMCFTALSESIGYIRCPSFYTKVNRNDLDDALAKFAGYKGVIIDVRANGGGLVSEAYLLASRFARQKTHVGYVRYKTGKGHSDFSEYYSRYVEPDGYFFDGKVAVLTNRGVYSAANLFVSIIQYLPQTRLFGDHTGGGGGVPISAELYNGWTVELSTNPVFDIDKRSIESGIEPHESIMLDNKDGKTDNIIERAKEWILE